MIYRKILLITIISVFLAGCVALPDLNPFNSGNDMTVVVLDNPIVVSVGNAPGFDLVYNGSVEGQIHFRSVYPEIIVEINSLENDDGHILADPTTPDPNINLKAKLLLDNQLSGSIVIPAEWKNKAWIESVVCSQTNPAFPCLELLCHSGPTIANCQLDKGFIAFRAKFSDGWHYGWMRVSITGLDGIMRLEAYAFNNAVGQGVRMGQI